jgi:hypothetical protein
MAMFDPAHPGELIRETIEGLREETDIKSVRVFWKHRFAV